MEPMTREQSRRVSMIKHLAKYFRRAAPERWAGLPDKRGARPTRLGANLFVLGCAIDFRRDGDSAWDAADYFLFNIVPSSQRERMWNWIVETHTPRRWDEKRAAYGLHRFPAGHKRVYRIARALVSLVDGDPRNLWRHAPKSVESIVYTESVLHAIQFGP